VFRWMMDAFIKWLQLKNLFKGFGIRAQL
jgi:hypothetical protein